MDANTQANLAAGAAAAQAIAPAFGPVAAAAVTAATALLTAALNSKAAGVDMTIDDFNAAVALDNAAIADDLKAQAEAQAAP